MEEKDKELNHYEKFVKAKKEWRKKHKRKKQWCSGCGYSYRGTSCLRCGGE